MTGKKCRVNWRFYNEAIRTPDISGKRKKKQSFHEPVFDKPLVKGDSLLFLLLSLRQSVQFVIRKYGTWKVDYLFNKRIQNNDKLIINPTTRKVIF